jgi:hypothetical protein
MTDLQQYRSRIKNQLLGDLRSQAKQSRKMETGEYRNKPIVPIEDHAHLARMYARKTTDYDNLVRKMNQFKGNKISNNEGYADASYGDNYGYYSDIDGDVDVNSVDEDFRGGRFNLGKSLKGASKVVGKEALKMGSKIASDVGKKVSDKIVSSATDAINQQLVGGKMHKFNFVKSMKHIGSALKVGTDVAKNVVKSGVKQLTDAGVNAIKSGLETYAPTIGMDAVETAPLLLAAGMKKPKRARKVSQREMNRHALIRKLMNDHGCSLAEASKHIKQNSLDY